MKHPQRRWQRLALAAAIAGFGSAQAQAQSQAPKRPNILVIMGDDVGWNNISAYHQGVMSGRTPNLDRLAAEGMRFTDYYAEASCTAGRANFITGELPVRLAHTLKGMAATMGAERLAQAARSAEALLREPGADPRCLAPLVDGIDELVGALDAAG